MYTFASIFHILSQVWFGRKSSDSKEFALHADICNLDSGFPATDYTSFLQSPCNRSVV